MGSMTGSCNTKIVSQQKRVTGHQGRVHSPREFGNYNCQIDPKEIKGRARWTWKKSARPLKAVEDFKSCLAVYLLFI